MLKNILAVIAGYIVMAFLVMSLYTVLLYALGPEMVYKPGIWEPSLLWIVLSFITGLVAAFLGGWVCLRIAQTPRAAIWLMGVVLILSLASIAAQVSATPTTEPRPAEVSPMDAASKSVPPMWASVGHLIVGVAGVWLARATIRT